MNLASFIRDIPDFPKPGIVFKDITPLLLDAGALDYAIEALENLAAVASHLKHLLLVRDLRRIAK